jgi:hypothetical protein
MSFGKKKETSLDRKMFLDGNIMYTHITQLQQKTEGKIQTQKKHFHILQNAQRPRYINDCLDIHITHQYTRT